MRSKIDGVINFIFEEIGIKGKVVIRENWLMKRFCVSRDDVWKIIDVVMKEMYDEGIMIRRKYEGGYGMVIDCEDVRGWMR